MILKDWIEGQGATTIAYRLGVTESAVHSWRTGIRRPKPEHAKALICLSEGQITWEDIYGLPACKTQEQA